MKLVCGTAARPGQEFRVLIGILVMLIFCRAASAQQPPTPNGDAMLTPVATKTDLYSAESDARKEIADALKQATADNKRVLLVFGANWCYDCHVLDRALHEGDAGEIVRRSFLVVHVDIGEGEKNPDLVKTYKIPLDKGVPAVAVLRGDGHLLYSSGEGEFESARRMLKKDLFAFLSRWQAQAR